MGLITNKFYKSYKQLIVSYILFTIMLIFLIFTSRSAIDMSFYPLCMNILFMIAFVENLIHLYKNYKFIISNNYKIYTKASKNFVFALMTISTILILLAEIFGNSTVENVIF